jgi:hypothetical protein
LFETDTPNKEVRRGRSGVPIVLSVDAYEIKKVDSDFFIEGWPLPTYYQRFKISGQFS